MQNGTTDDKGDRVKCQKSKFLEKTKRMELNAFMEGLIGLCHQEILCYNRKRGEEIST